MLLCSYELFYNSRVAHQVQLHWTPWYKLQGFDGNALTELPNKQQVNSINGYVNVSSLYTHTSTDSRLPFLSLMEEGCSTRGSHRVRQMQISGDDDFGT